MAHRPSPVADGGPPTSLRSTLPGASYTDPAVFAREVERIFSAEWMCVVRAGELDGPGSYHVVDVGHESVIVSRDAGGGVRAFLNVCRHRGSRVCTEGAGQVRRHFQCAYHAWTYGLDGRLVAAPNLWSMPDVDRDGLGLRPVAVREWLGYVWVCLAGEPPDFATTVVSQVSDRLGGPDAVDAYGIDGLAVGRRVTYDVAANWKLIVENFMECYHCATIHPELTDVLPEFTNGLAAQYFVGHGAEFGGDVAGFTIDGRPGLDRLERLGEEQDRRYFAVTVRPQVFVNLVPDHVIWHRMTPVAADRTVVVCDWLFDPAVVAAGTDIEPSVELFHRVNTQDFTACERCQPAMSSAGYRDGGVLVPAEHHISQFHDWVTGRIGGEEEST